MKQRVLMVKCKGKMSCEIENRGALNTAVTRQHFSVDDGGRSARPVGSRGAGARLSVSG